MGIKFSKRYFCRTTDGAIFCVDCLEEAVSHLDGGPSDYSLVDLSVAPDESWYCERCEERIRTAIRTK